MNKLEISDALAYINEQKIDFFICSASFEERCLSIPDKIYDSYTGEVLVFCNTNEDPVIIENCQKIKGKFPERCHVIDLNTDYPVKNYYAIYANLEQQLKKDGGNKRVLLETTTFTHEALLMVFKVLYQLRGLYEILEICYVGASDYSYESVSDEDKWLSKGIREIRTVIGYPGISDPTKKNRLVILFGFESDRTKKLIDFYEFDTVSLGFGKEDQSINSSLHKINFERHCVLLEHYKEFAKKFEISLIDPIDSCYTIIEQVILDLYEHNVVLAPMNNKISTIGAAMAAIIVPELQISYAKANVYNTKAYAKASNECYFSKIDLDFIESQKMFWEQHRLKWEKIYGDYSIPDYGEATITNTYDAKFNSFFVSETKSILEQTTKVSFSKLLENKN